MKKPAKISELLDEVLAAQGLSSVAWMVRITAGWPGIVGPILSGKSVPSKLKNGLLTVLVRDHSWAQELQLRKPVVIRRIAEAVGEERIRDIRFVTGPLPGPETEESVPREKSVPVRPPVGDPEGLSEIGDSETREILRSLFRKALSRTR